jgi:competence protein ComEC
MVISPVTVPAMPTHPGTAMTLVYLTFAWMAGILLAYALWSLSLVGCATPGWPLGVLAAAAALTAILLRRRPAGRLIAVLLAFCMLGAWRYHAQPFAACTMPGDLAFYNGDEEHTVWATVEGVVVGYPDVRDMQTLYRLRADTVAVSGAASPVTGDLLVQANRFPGYAYGDRLRVRGQLQTPPVLDDFDYRRYLAQRGIHSLMRRATVTRVAEDQGSPFWVLLYRLKARGSGLLDRVLPEPAAALANGMLLGIESGIPEDVDEAFKATGTTHVIVISGSNIALLSGVLMAGLSQVFGKRRAAFPAIAGITLYVLLVGADPAALRAGIMGGLFILAIYLGRRSTAYVSLCASALFMTLFNPLTLWDIGFQLSFMATLGLILFTPTIERQFERLLARRLAKDSTRRVMSVLNDALIVTLAAQVTTLPVIVYYFGRVSLISLVTNFLILPAQPPIMTSGMATLVAGLAWEPLARGLALIPWLFLTYTTAVVRLTAAVPFASVETGALGRAAALIYIAALVGALLWRELRRRGWVKMSVGRATGWAVVVVLPLWLAGSVLAARPDGKLHSFFIPGAGGEATLIVTPGGQSAWLWDGRGDGAALVSPTRSLLAGPQKSIDVVIGPGTAALWPGAEVVTPDQLAPGTVVRLDDEVSLTRLTAVASWMLSYGQFRTLLPPTLTPEAQAELLTAGADVHTTVFKTPGPDTDAWPTAAFLTASAPQRILWPEDTTYPPDVVDLLTARGAARVPVDAVVEVVTDGTRMWLHQRSGEVRR